MHADPALKRSRLTPTDDRRSGRAPSPALPLPPALPPAPDAASARPGSGGGDARISRPRPGMVERISAKDRLGERGSADRPSSRGPAERLPSRGPGSHPAEGKAARSAGAASERRGGANAASAGKPLREVQSAAAQRGGSTLSRASSPTGAHLRWRASPAIRWQDAMHNLLFKHNTQVLIFM